MDDCIFCKIVDKKIPANVVWEDSDILAFEDINPQAPVHVLVIPKEHFSSLNEVPPDRMAAMGKILTVLRRIAQDRKIDARGYRIVLNTGKDSGQEVQHIHFHLFGGRHMTWPPG